MEIIQYSNYVLGSGAEEFYYLNPRDSWEDSVRGLVRAGHVMIARMGRNGSKAFSMDEEVERPAFHVTVEDTVGAGDVYNAGFIAKRLEAAPCPNAWNMAMRSQVIPWSAREPGPAHTGMTWKHFWKDTGRNHER